jgi:WD40 repeat protein
MGATGAEGGVAMGDPDAGTQDAPPPCAQFGAGHATALAYTSDGRSWAAAYSSGAVVIYDASTGAITQRLSGHVGAANAVAFTPDGAHLVSAGDDGLVKAWKVADGTLSWSGQGDSLSSVESVAVSPDGTLVAGTGIQGTMKLWLFSTAIAKTSPSLTTNPCWESRAATASSPGAATTGPGRSPWGRA